MWMSIRPDERLAAEFSYHYSTARAELLAEMERLGLREKDGWRIHETTRHVTDGTELVLRPIHRTLEPPSGLERVVRICA